MAYIIDSLRKIDSKSKQKFFGSYNFSKEDKLLVLIVVIGIAVVVIDFCLVLKFVNIINSI